MRHAVVIAILTGWLASAAALYPRTSAPGGLSPERTPMFILFTHDDALKEKTYEAMLEVTEGRQSTNSCPAVGTMFTTSNGTDCELLVDLYNRGYEVADHTISHPSLLTLDKGGIEEEVVGARSSLAACGIPESDIVGLRCPFLETKPEVREVLQENGFLYDSTLIEESTGHSLSDGPASRIWPWDMRHGIPINCNWYSSIQKCNAGEEYRGLWQVPLWPLSGYTMDYGMLPVGMDGERDVYKILKANFDAAYEGNRAPLPIFIHTPWLVEGNHLRRLKKFARYALSKPDVYFVTVRQLLAWMNNPVPADELTPSKLGCGNPGGAGPTTHSLYTMDGIVAAGPAGGPVGTPGPAPAPGPEPEAEPPLAAPAPAPADGAADE